MSNSLYKLWDHKIHKFFPNFIQYKSQQNYSQSLDLLTYLVGHVFLIFLYIFLYKNTWISNRLSQILNLLRHIVIYVHLLHFMRLLLYIILRLIWLLLFFHFIFINLYYLILLLALRNTDTMILYVIKFDYFMDTIVSNLFSLKYAIASLENKFNGYM